MIVDSACYRDGVRHAADLGPDALERLRATSGEGDFVWVGLHEPDAAEMRRVADAFSLHPLAVEDSLSTHQRPKVEPYDDQLFVVLKTLWYIDERDEVETSVFAPERTQNSQRIYVLKREISEVRRAVQPLRAPMQRFAGGGYPFIHSDATPFFRDVADHVIRVGDVIETLDSLLSTAFEANLARISLQQNEDTRRISAWVAIAAVGTLVAGIYGMNFDHMPELHWRFGYAWALGLMLASSLLLYRTFKRSGWL